LQEVECGYYAVKYFQKELSVKEQFAINFFTKVKTIGFDLPQSKWEQGITGEVVKTLEMKIKKFNQYNDPQGIYMDCLCEVN